MTFEESAKKLAEMSEKIKDEDITLEERCNVTRKV